jgi:putative ABC transport system substrate-binding protein
MDRRTFLVFAIAALATPLAAEAQRPSRVSRIGYLDSGASASAAAHLEAFRQGLRDLGWVEGENIAIEARYAEGKYERLHDLAAELVRLKVDVLCTTSTPAALAAKQATSTIPIVIGRVADPVRSGVVASLARPGGNITGWTHLGLDLRAKYLDLLKEAVPAASRLGALWNPANPVHLSSLKPLEAGAQALKVQLHPVGVQDPKEFENAFPALARQRVEALAVLPDALFLAHRDLIVALAAQHRLPALYGMTEFAAAGGLMAYGVNLATMYRSGASFVDKILKGAKPADLPVEQPTKFELIINMKTAKTLGLTIPPSLLLRADQAIE